MPETMSSAHAIDPRISAVLERHHCKSDELEADLHAVLAGIEMEHYYAESCAGEEFLRDQGRAAIKRGEAPSAKFYGTLADIFKKVREKRFPLLVQKLKQNQN